MKIRYYLRGLGLGILFTATFFLVSNNSSSQTMSDEQIKARAKELGMIESTVLAELSTQETVEETVVETVEEETVIEETTVETVEELTTEENMVETVEETAAGEVIEETIEETKSEETMEEASISPAATESEANESSQTASNAAPITVVVNRGEGSDTVSRRLVELGLVADAHEYDRYLMTNGYDKKIGAGEHVIPAGATWEEIAKILCNQM